MVNEKRVERKLTILITDGSWDSSEFDRNDARLRKLKRTIPDRYLFHKNKIIDDLKALKRETEQFGNHSK